jgi:hypothetical protein
MPSIQVGGGLGVFGFFGFLGFLGGFVQAPGWSKGWRCRWNRTPGGPSTTVLQCWPVASGQWQIARRGLRFFFFFFLAPVSWTHGLPPAPNSFATPAASAPIKWARLIRLVPIHRVSWSNCVSSIGRTLPSTRERSKPGPQRHRVSRLHTACQHDCGAEREELKKTSEAAHDRHGQRDIMECYVRPIGVETHGAVRFPKLCRERISVRLKPETVAVEDAAPSQSADNLLRVVFEKEIPAS